MAALIYPHYMNQFSDYSEFQSEEEFNKLTSEILYYFASDLNDTDKAIIRHMAGCAKNPYATGVAYRKVKTIATAINKSERTVRYSTKKIELLGIFYKVQLYKPIKGGNGSNAYVFTTKGLELKKESCRASIAGREYNENTKLAKGLELKKKNDTFIISTKKDLNNNIEKEDKLNSIIYQELLSYKQINKRLENVYGPSKANQYWKRIIWAFRNSELYEEVGLLHLQDLLNADRELELKIANTIAMCTDKYKNGNIKKTFEGYLYISVLKLFQSIAANLQAQKTSYTNSNNFLSHMYTLEKQYIKQRQLKSQKETISEDWIDIVF